jgi:hypothetical protein
MSDQKTKQDEIAEIIQLSGFVSGYAEALQVEEPLLREQFEKIAEKADQITDKLLCLTD